MEWKHWAMIAAGGVAALATYMMKVDLDPMRDSIYLGISEVAGVAVMFFGGSSNKMIAGKKDVIVGKDDQK